MGYYFKGWRRNTGVVTLVMACVAMGGWVRSAHVEDDIQILIPIFNFLSVDSGDQTFCIIVGQHSRNDLPLASWETSLPSLPMRQYEPTYEMSFWGIGVFVVDDMLFFDYSGVFAPYWAVVIPLTLLSAFLLLSKPRKSTKNKAIEPIPDEMK
jgi:hypothetical protein